MRLLKYRVTNFRSVEDSGWIDVDDITVLIGTNESGKTNLILPLWKLNPAGTDGAIIPLLDYPRIEYNRIRNMPKKPVFITAIFALPASLRTELSKATGNAADEFDIVSIKRDFGGDYYVEFLNAVAVREYPTADVGSMLSRARNEIEMLQTSGARDEALKPEVITTLDDNLANLSSTSQQVEDFLNLAGLRRIKTSLSELDFSNVARTSAIRPRVEQLLEQLAGIETSISRMHPNSVDAAVDIILENLLSFVYYSNYGNLDSNIYLPHVIENLSRTDLGVKEAARARTLRVLFQFVNLQPQEILRLGRNPVVSGEEPTPEEIEQLAEARTERTILLHSASASLTKSFKEWWKQGTYTFRFEADGDFFRIFVSDDLRPEPIELESRSTGLQWFFSFYLVFLVEGTGAHQNAMLLLDEPGLTLHPLAQRELSVFFNSIAEANQIMYTSHSPFMVDPDHLDRVRSVYVDTNGRSLISSDLRASVSDTSQSHSIYAVHAALGLSVSDMLMQGCQAVIVEGQSDQFYLSGIKLYLLSKGLLTPDKELLFVPSGGVRGVTAIANILTGHDELLPRVLLDGDKPGADLARNLRAGLYQADQDRVLLATQYVSVPDAEIEDLMPDSILADVIGRRLRGPIGDFDQAWTAGIPIVPQVRDWAAKHNFDLDVGWKVEVSKRFKAQLAAGALTIPNHVEIKWTELFEMLLEA